jgi:predicted dehydrogenase
MSLRFGLIGCGDFGRHLGRYLLEVARIAGLCDPEVERARATARELGIDAPCWADYRPMLAEGQLDAVAITAANFAHAQIAVAAAQAGLHVFCEKAMARTVPECWQMVRACQEAGVRLMVGHKRRLRPPWARMIELTRPGGPLGEPLAIHVCGYADYRPYRFTESWWGDPERSGGQLHATNVHVIDWLRAMCGEARQVSAVCGPQHEPRYRYPDIIHATFAFHSGAVASLSSAMTFPLHRFRQSEGPWGVCREGGFKLVPELDHIDLHWQRLDEEVPHCERFEDLGFDHAYRRELGDFAAWVQEGRPPCLSWVEGLRCVELMEAAHCSAQAGGQPVTLPLYPELEPS